MLTRSNSIFSTTRVCPGRSSRRGSVILFVLGVILLTAFLLSRLIDRAGGELLAETKAANRAALRDQAYAGLEVTLAVLADVSAADGGLFAAQQGWDRPLEYANYQPPAGYELNVTYEDETGKLPLATVSEPVLQHYLETVGANVADAERLTDAILTWTKKDHLPASSEADPRNYESSPLPYEPPRRALRSFEELRAVSVARELFFDADGRWSDLGNRFRADASLFEFSNVNVNTARTAALVGLGLDQTSADAMSRDLAAQRKNEDRKFFRSAAEAAATHGGGLTQAGFGAEVQCLRVLVTVRLGARFFTLAAVVVPGGGQANANTAPAEEPDANGTAKTPVDARALTRKSVDYPFRILELRETDGPV